MSRAKLLSWQVYITLGLYALLSIIYAVELWSKTGGFHKLVIAPLGAVSLLLFALFGYNRTITDFNEEDGEEKPYPARAFVTGLLVMLSVTLSMRIVIPLVRGTITTMERMIFVFSAFVCFTLFCHMRYRNLLSMAVVTGMAEGIILYLVFFSG